MAIYHPYQIRCSCGCNFTAQLARGINIQRTPELKQKIIEGKFHRVSCPKCKSEFTVEKEFYYTDFKTNLFIHVKPRQEKYLWKKASAELTKQVNDVPPSLAPAQGRKLRVVFGMNELREKLIAQDYDLDDRMVELMKVLLIHDHPILIQRPRLQISLDKIGNNSINFKAAYDHDNKRFQLAIPRWVADNFLSKDDQVKDWVNKAHYHSNIFQLKDDHWINFWRWSPQPSALDLLRSFASKLEQGQTIDTESADFKTMTTYIPKGSQLPAWAKKDLNTLFQYAKDKNIQQLQDTLFEIRFDKILEDDWYLNDDPNDIDTLWKLLNDLPETNVDGNIEIHEIFLDNGQGGGTYDPQTKDIYIGSEELENKERFEDVVRHEIGHGVHEKFKAVVDNWLLTQFGWQTFDTTNSDIDAWIEQMGGWQGLNSLEQSQVRSYLTEALGPGGKWTQGNISFVPPDHPWNNQNFGPRLVYEKTGDNWFQNFGSWYRYNGKAFFLNYWYRTLCVVNEDTLRLVEKMPSDYASMSHFEFFAELYALYYDKDDPMRSNIPANIGQWLDANIGNIKTHPMMPDSPVVRKSFDWIKRPYE
ncbi:MAG: CpXC domain-containing protein [Ferruginibacter sp.]